MGEKSDKGKVGRKYDPQNPTATISAETYGNVQRERTDELAVLTKNAQVKREAEAIMAKITEFQSLVKSYTGRASSEDERQATKGKLQAQIVTAEKMLQEYPELDCTENLRARIVAATKQLEDFTPFIPPVPLPRDSSSGIPESDGASRWSAGENDFTDDDELLSSSSDDSTQELFKHNSHHRGQTSHQSTKSSLPRLRRSQVSVSDDETVQKKHAIGYAQPPTPPPPTTKFDAFHQKEVLPILKASYYALKAYDSAGNGVCAKLLKTINDIEPGFTGNEKPPVSSRSVTKAPDVSGTPGTSGTSEATGGPDISAAPMTSQAHLELLNELNDKLGGLLQRRGEMSPDVATSLEELQVVVANSINIVKQQVDKEKMHDMRTSLEEKEVDKTPQDEQKPTPG